MLAYQVPMYLDGRSLVRETVSEAFAFQKVYSAGVFFLGSFARFVFSLARLWGGGGEGTEGGKGEKLGCLE